MHTQRTLRLLMGALQWHLLHFLCVSRTIRLGGEKSRANCTSPAARAIFFPVEEKSLTAQWPFIPVLTQDAACPVPSPYFMVHRRNGYVGI